MKTYTYARTLQTNLAFPEGPAFAPDGSLWAVELKGESLVRVNEGTVQRYRVGGAPNGLAIDTNGQIWYCDAAFNAVRRFDPGAEQAYDVVTSVRGEALTKPNDLAFDTVGNLVFTCPGDSRREPTGYVCVLTATGEVQKIAENLFFPNGLAFMANGGELIIAETYRHRLWKGRWDVEKAEWSAASVWAEVDGPDGPGGPDGMALDAEGNLFVAVYGTGTIQVIDPVGQLINRLALPGKCPTNCAFGGVNGGELIVTEAERGELIAFTAKP